MLAQQRPQSIHLIDIWDHLCKHDFISRSIDTAFFHNIHRKKNPEFNSQDHKQTLQKDQNIMVQSCSATVPLIHRKPAQKNEFINVFGIAISFRVFVCLF